MLPTSDRLSPNTTRLLNGPAATAAANSPIANRATPRRNRPVHVRAIPANHTISQCRHVFSGADFTPDLPADMVVASKRALVVGGLLLWPSTKQGIRCESGTAPPL